RMRRMSVRSPTMPFFDGGELVLVRDEDLEAVDAQHSGALVHEPALVRREERAGEVDLQGADATDLLPAFKPGAKSPHGLESLVQISRDKDDSVVTEGLSLPSPRASTSTGKPPIPRTAPSLRSPDPRDELDLDRDVERQLRHAHRRSGVPTGF